MTHALNERSTAPRRLSRIIGRGLVLVSVLASTAVAATQAEAANPGSPIIGMAGKCLTDAGGSTADGAPVTISTCPADGSQNWTAPTTGTINTYGKCLDVRWGAKTPGTLVQLWTCNGSTAQNWTFSGGALVNPRSGLCLDLIGNVSTNGTRTEIDTCAPGAASQSWMVGGSAASATRPGYARDFFDDFNTTLNTTVWGRYGFGLQAPGNGVMGYYDVNNVYTDSGNLVLRNRYANGAWTAAGVSGSRGFSAVQGEWQIRARFDRSKGVGFAFLLYPSDGSWPPELDILEAKVNGPSTMSTLHWGSTNQQYQLWNQVPDMTAWHTYGVIMDPTKITYTIDGVAWASFNSANVPTKKMWFGMQSGAHSCPDTYECVTNNVPDADTAALSNIQIDWVAHYASTV